MKRFNWPIWLGLLLSVVAFLSYYLFLAQFPITRDVPWVTWLLFLIAIALMVAGWRRAPRKILVSIVLAAGLFIAAAFTHMVTLGSKLPAAPNAPAVGAHAPDFVLPDADGRMVSLSGTLVESNGVLLVFYRGHW